MESQTQISTVSQSSCDESKCVSTGLYYELNRTHTCYGDDGEFHPRMCIDGFVPVVVESEPARGSSDVWENENDNISVQYFTCCPPNQSSYDEIDATRHCSDPILNIEDGDASTICQSQEIRVYPRRMTPLPYPLSTNELTGYVWAVREPVLCCDSLLPNSNDDEGNTASTSNFLDDVECLPYKNEFYYAAWVQNRPGVLMPRSCDFVEGADFEDFLFPRASGVSANTYQCCKSGFSIPPFVQDSNFKINVYPKFALCTIAAILSAITALGLLIPLTIELKNKYRRKTTQGRSRAKQAYSMYNLYLVHMAFFDFLFIVYQMVFLVRAMNQGFEYSTYGPYGPMVSTTIGLPSLFSWDYQFSITYVIGNVWINAIVSYQIFLLLRSSHRARRVKPLSLMRVNLECGAVYLLMTIFLIVVYFMHGGLWEALLNSGFETFTPRQLAMTYLGITLQWVPIIFVFGITILIWWRGYIPSMNGASPRDRAMRQLAFYFLRIIAVFLLLWIPALILQKYTYTSNEPWPLLVSQWLYSLQPILTVIMILTKDDVRTYILDLITLSYFFGDCNCWKKDEALPTEGSNDAEVQTPAKRVSILGYSFPPFETMIEEDKLEADIKGNENSD